MLNRGIYWGIAAASLIGIGGCNMILGFDNEFRLADCTECQQEAMSGECSDAATECWDDADCNAFVACSDTYDACRAQYPVGESVFYDLVFGCVCDACPQCSCDYEPPECTDTNSPCGTNEECCNFQQGTGYCVSSYCADSCTYNGDCASGCCAETETGEHVCQAADVCGTDCTQTGLSCSINGDCCNFWGGMGYCVDGICSDTCAADYQCESNCCGPTTIDVWACLDPWYCG